MRSGFVNRTIHSQIVTIFMVNRCRQAEYDCLYEAQKWYGLIEELQLSQKQQEEKIDQNSF